MAYSPDVQCCPKFDPIPFLDKVHKWDRKRFIMDTIPQIAHIPLPGKFAKVFSGLWKAAQLSDAAPDVKDFLMLSYDPSPWKSELYIAVNKEVPNAKNVIFSGVYVSKVFDGPFDNVSVWIKEFEKYLSDNRWSPKKYYFYFTTCPRCARKYGHNYVVIFAEI
ncbi:hypothetical protein JW962_00470 [Candidatus Dojkabacteria bacterium]|nr:hypothetical protein [Candidatus Dojkabacteria bacterium]